MKFKPNAAAAARAAVHRPLPVGPSIAAATRRCIEALQKKEIERKGAEVLHQAFVSECAAVLLPLPRGPSIAAATRRCMEALWMCVFVGV